ncbi:hypothetical protein [uncultured Tessaracoccus sp.]|uniref:hypothetical protein n=1 Tax=uncultured Tessaracoccus sp. TaxID=905023 RepID=UPI002618DAD2|nr:hypothetical protein [uncultured Tessaracoccus sp.]
MDFRVDWSVLSEARGRLETISNVASSASQTMRIHRVSDALPGSMSAGRAASLDSEFQTSSRQIVSQLETHAQAMGETASAYEQCEQRACQEVESFFEGI